MRARVVAAPRLVQVTRPRNPVALHTNVYLEAGYETITYTGDVETDINTICENLRVALRQAVAEAKEEMIRRSPQYIAFSFRKGRGEGANISLDLIGERPEEDFELAARLEREAKEKAKQDLLLAKSKAKDMAKIKELALKHNLPLEIREGVQGNEANGRDQS